MRSLFVLLLGTLLLASCTTVNVRPGETAEEPADTPDTTTAPAADEDTDEDEEEDPFGAWDETLEDTEKIEGFLTLHRKEDRTLYAEVPPEQLGSTFGLVLHVSQGAGVFNLHDGLRLSSTRLMQFQRVGHKIHLVHRNPRFRADAGPMRTSLKENTAHSVVHAFDIVSRNDSTKHLLIELSDFLVSDYANVGERLKLYFGQAPAPLQKGKSHVDRAMSFPKNTEIDVALTYQGGQAPLIGGEVVPDYRAVPVGVRYSLFALPESPMQRRPADDRVGYFTNAVKDFSKDKQSDPFIRYVQRWRLAPSDTAAYKRGELVEPEEPIVYYVDRTVPEEYRPYVRQGIEAWNEAFREAGYKNAVVAKDAPDDSTWSAEDIRYSTVQWTAAHQMGYAIGPSQSDPRTGEILNADILISSEFVRGWTETFENLMPSVEQSTGETQIAPPMQRTVQALRRMFPAELARRACVAERHRAQQIGLQRAVLLSRGALDPGTTLPEAYLGDAIRDLVMHEVGHTLGLRHNFKASSALDHDRLHDEQYTSEHGVSVSVMDYAPVNVALEASNQGHYWNRNVGTYDRWAIKYGYMPISEQSGEGALTRNGPLADTTTAAEPGLDKIAAGSSDPMHLYGTDEDLAFGAYAVDPLTNAGVLGDDPLAFAETRTQLVRTVEPKLDDRLVAEGERYHRLRQATTTLLFERYQALSSVTRTVGGMYVSRDHKGTPNARMPFRPVSAEKQRAAVEVLVDAAFAPDAFQFDPDRLNKLAPDRQSRWSISFDLEIDYPVHENVHLIQSGLLSDLLHPTRLQRMIDNQVRTPDGEAYGPGDLMGRLTDAIWSELGPDGQLSQPINSFRRNLQRTYTDHLIQLMLNTTTWITITVGAADQVDAPEDVRSIARLELKELSSQIEAALSSGGLDRETRAHLSETQTRIERALDASVEVTP